MNQKQSKHAISRAWPALGAVAIMAVGLTGVSGAWAAEPTPTAGTNSDARVVLDNNSLWRHVLITRCAYVRGDDGKLEPWDLAPLGHGSGWPPGLEPKPAATNASSPLPPADWAGPNMDDRDWPRARLPQPVGTFSTPARALKESPTSRRLASTACLTPFPPRFR